MKKLIDNASGNTILDRSKFLAIKRQWSYVICVEYYILHGLTYYSLWITKYHLLYDDVIVPSLFLSKSMKKRDRSLQWSSRKAWLLTMTLVIFSPFLFPPKKENKWQKSWSKVMPFWSIITISDTISKHIPLYVHDVMIWSIYSSFVLLIYQ